MVNQAETAGIRAEGLKGNIPDGLTLELRRYWEVLDGVPDPEIPVISVVDLGIVTRLTVAEDGAVRVILTPTFAGCPALRWMEKTVQEALLEAGASVVEVQTTFENPWTSERISEAGREKIRNFGLAPPPRRRPGCSGPDLDALARAACPRCGSENTSMKSPFGPTLCRSLHYCFDCLEAFEQFKPL
ncbi:MAG: phenylacetate-CoA oxygenase subunit PaaJ [Sphingomonadales bacterium]|nr:phenylacetate-CoA oxygenase subunit PaaJ [Sphingomonadales bacterium]